MIGRITTAGVITLVSAPIFPFTAIGIADHLSERRRDRDAAAAAGAAHAPAQHLS